MTEAASRPPVELSVVVPVYGCAAALAELCQRVADAVEGVVDSHEVILVDDASPDDAWPVIAGLAETRGDVVGLRLSRNFGQHAAVTAGYAEAVGEITVVIDCDLQDPPEQIPRFIEKVREGYDVVYGRRSERAQAWHRRVLAGLYTFAANKIGRQNQKGANSSFTAISRKARAAFVRMIDRDRHHLFLLGWVGFSSTHVDYDRDERYAGESSYTLRKLIAHAMTGMFLQTTTLLHWIVTAGLLISFAGLGVAAWVLWRYLTDSILPGFTSLLLAQMLLSGAILSSVGVVGLYVGRVFEQTKGQPLYIVRTRVGGAAGDHPHPGGFDATPGVFPDVRVIQRRLGQVARDR